MATRKVKITCPVHIIFLLDSAALEVQFSHVPENTEHLIRAGLMLPFASYLEQGSARDTVPKDLTGFKTDPEQEKWVP